MDGAGRAPSRSGLARRARRRASLVGVGQLRADQAAAHPADHRHAVGDASSFQSPRDLVQPRPAHQAARRARRLHHRLDPRRAERRLGRAGARAGLSGCCSSGRSTAAGSRPSARTPRAARLAGVPVDGVRAATYVLCGGAGGALRLPAVLLLGRRGAQHGRGYLLTSIAVVVIGGTSVAGGASNVPGIWGASLFLFLIVSMLNTYGLGAGVRLILTGRHHHRASSPPPRGRQAAR